MNHVLPSRFLHGVTLLAALSGAHCGGDLPVQNTPSGALDPNAGRGAIISAGAAASSASNPTAGSSAAMSNSSMTSAGRSSAAGGSGTAASSPIAGTAAMAGRSALTGGASGSASGSAGAAGSSNAGSSASSGAWPKVDDFSANGPFTATTVTSTGPSNGYTLYHPKELGRDGLKHPLITWGNGATTTPELFSLLPLLATHGFVVIASNNAFVTGAELKGGIDWLLMENGRKDSVLYQKLDPNEVASMGYSLGSVGTFEIAADPRLKTTVHISGGAMDKSVVPNLHNPAAFLCGDSSDIAHDNCVSDFEMAKVPVFFGVFAGDHLGILGSHTTQINKAAATWLRWRLMHDTSLNGAFTGADCTLCKDSAWTVQRKSLDTPP